MVKTYTYYICYGYTDKRGGAHFRSLTIVMPRKQMDDQEFFDKIKEKVEEQTKNPQGGITIFNIINLTKIKPIMEE